MQSVYLDTCIYLNLWKRETGRRGQKYWLYSKKLFDFTEKQGIKILYSGIILKEILFVLSTEDYIEKRELFRDEKFEKITILQKDYMVAKRIKSKLNTGCSPADILHMVVSKRTKTTLITRDRELRSLAKRFRVKCQKPEEFIRNLSR